MVIKKKNAARSANKRKTAKLKPADGTLGMQVIHPYAAGIDVGNEEHYVAVPPMLDKDSVRVFGCFTADLIALATWLSEIGVKTVALQSTGVYWIPLYDVLTQRGIQVFVVNARDTRHVPGRKTDVLECQWILKLHVHGLLRSSFRPTAEVLKMRTLWRQRDELVVDAARCTQRMQKALTQMNVQLANVINDITGVSGMAILSAIEKGERNPQRLAGLCEPGIKASQEEVMKSLEGNWAEEHLFVLQQQLAIHRHFQRMIEDCDKELYAQFQTMEQKADPAELPKVERHKRPRGNAVTSFDLRKELYRMVGVDLTGIDGINIMTAQTVLSEIGYDVSAWNTEAQFVSWLNLAPRDKISGGKVIGRDGRKIINHAGQALRLSANSLRNSDSYLGAQYRRLRGRLDTAAANKAMGAKLARLMYRMLKYGKKYLDKGAEYYERNCKDQQLRSLTKQAAKLGYTIAKIA
jgi:transposase